MGFSDRSPSPSESSGLPPPVSSSSGPRLVTGTVLYETIRDRGVIKRFLVATEHSHLLIELQQVE